MVGLEVKAFLMNLFIWNPILASYNFCEFYMRWGHQSVVNVKQLVACQMMVSQADWHKQLSELERTGKTEIKCTYEVWRASFEPDVILSQREVEKKYLKSKNKLEVMNMGGPTNKQNKRHNLVLFILWSNWIIWSFNM